MIGFLFATLWFERFPPALLFGSGGAGDRGGDIPKAGLEKQVGRELEVRGGR